MKIVKIIGGLGNQMFQFAFFLYLKEKGVNTKLDITGFEKYELHQGIELDTIFNVIQKQYLANRSEINAYKDQSPFFKFRKIIDRICFNSTNYFIKKTHWLEPKYSHFYSDIYKIKHNYLEGYWQNENYLKENESLIRASFQWLSIDEKNIELKKIMELQESISLHIRRLDNPHNFKQLFYFIRLRLVWRIASRKYYLRAIKYFDEHIENPHFYIFTDNLNWVKKNIPVKYNYTIVDWNRGSQSNQDMFLMSQCKYNIISMSSFSWWGAWLNNNQKKIVISPKKWAPRFSFNSEIIPKEWIRL